MPPAAHDAIAPDLDAPRASAAAPAPSDALERSIDELLGDLEQPGDAAAPGNAAPPAMSASIDAALADATGRAADPPTPASVEDLDAHLAVAADEAMRATEAPTDSAFSDSAPPGPATSLGEAALDAPPDRSAAPVEAPADPAPAEPPADTPGEPSVLPVVVSASPEPLSAATSNPAADRRTALDRLGAILAAPMALIPPASRDYVGWFALVTLFNAACVWIYLLM
jgi:hypothetical protein